jgi:tetratricopeptide (TPR) repeat protein
MTAILRLSASLSLIALLGSCMSMQNAQERAASANSAQRDQADALFKEGEYEKAITSYDLVLAADPQDSYAYGQRGECYRLLSRYDEAIADFTRAIELNPENAWALGSRADAYRLLEKFDKALADFNRAIELDPGYQWALARRGETLRITSDYPRSLADLNRAIELAPADSFPYASRGQVYREMGERQKALADFDKAIEIDPEYTWAKERRQELYAELAGTGARPPASAPAARPAGPLPLVTVLDFNIENLPKSDGRLIVDLVFSTLVTVRKYRVLDRGQRDNILKEVEFSLSACADEKCQLEIGRLLAADRIVVGSLGKVGQRYILNAKMLDVRTGEALSSAHKVFGTLEELVDGTEEVALTLSEGANHERE